MNGHSIQRMRWWHIAAVAELEKEVFPDTAWSPAQFWGELARENRSYYVLTESGSQSSEVLGYAGLSVIPPDADIQTVAVAPQVQGQGWGSRLVDTLLEAARKHGCSSVILEVAHSNESALRLYRRMGFSAISRRSGYYGPGQDALIMKWRHATEVTT
jgi:[ribosomal protein S18]-alanine N-acetyltransferase